MIALLRELWLFVRQNKKWWLLPMIAILLLIGTVMFFTQGSVLAPFIYTIF